MPTSNPVIVAGRKGIENYLEKAASLDAQQAHLCGATGPVTDLEYKLKNYYGMKHAVCVSNATTGLFALALAANLRRSEFVTTPFTYGATIAGWLMLGSRPIFADISPDTLTLDCDSIKKAITPKTKAVLAVDIFGIPSDTRALRQLADEYGVWYFADASQSLGATRDGLRASELADALVVSFTAGKTVFAGEGGAILTNNTDLYEKLIWYTQHPSRHRRELGLDLDNEFAFNGRIAPTSAAWAASAFEISLKTLRDYQRCCFKVIDALNQVGLTEPIRFKEDSISPTFFRLTATWKGSSRERALLEELKSRSLHMKIEPSPVRLIYQQPSFQAQYRSVARKALPCPVAEQQSQIRFCLT